MSETLKDATDKKYQEMFLAMKRKDAVELMKLSAHRLRQKAEEVDRYVAQFEAVVADQSKSNVSEAEILDWCVNALANLNQNLQLSAYVRTAVEITMAKGSGDANVATSQPKDVPIVRVPRESK